jgi:hypothetical protein
MDRVAVFVGASQGFPLQKSQRTAIRSAINPSEIATIAITADSSKKVRRMLGLLLHGWENVMVVFLILAGFTALVAGVSTWAVVRLQRIELAGTEQEFDKYKLDTAKEIAEANEKSIQGQLELQRLKAWRMLDGAKFKSALEGVTPPALVEILYVTECSDCFMFSGMIEALLKDAHWPASLAEVKKPNPQSQAPALLQYRANPTGVTILSKKGVNVFETNPVSGLLKALSSSDTWLGGGLISDDDRIPEGIVRVIVAPKI